jgi:hypothetical protein
MATRFQVTFDCADPARLAAFWATALHYERQPPPHGYATWEAFAAARGIPEERRSDYDAVVDPGGAGPRLLFLRVPEPKTVKNRVHLDVDSGAPKGTSAEQRRAHVHAEVDRLVAAGATRVGPKEEYGLSWVVMRDPEGNEFCVH